jgi:hypothetical protein
MYIRVGARRIMFGGELSELACRRLIFIPTVMTSNCITGRMIRKKKAELGFDDEGKDYVLLRILETAVSTYDSPTT